MEKWLISELDQEKIENEFRRLCCKRIRKYLKKDKVGVLLSNFF